MGVYWVLFLAQIVATNQAEAKAFEDNRFPGKALDFHLFAAAGRVVFPEAAIGNFGILEDWIHNMICIHRKFYIRQDPSDLLAVSCRPRPDLQNSEDLAADPFFENMSAFFHQALLGA